MKPLNKTEFIKGVAEFRDRETRDAMYKIASYLTEHFWGAPADMADGIGVLLLTWNQAFYRYGSFDFSQLESCLEKHLEDLNNYRLRDIFTYTQDDQHFIRVIFLDLLDALSNAKGKSPVAVSKALHLLAPKFFPLWDLAIAKAYKCYYQTNPEEKYLSFIELTKDLAQIVKPYAPNGEKSLIKTIDEYNYSKYTKEWI